MKNYFLKITTLLILMFSLSMFAQVDSTTFLQKVETSTVSSLDGFITKYEPKISNKLGDLWEFAKTTSDTMYDAFVRYLIVKDGFPILIGLIVILLLKLVTNRIKKIVNETNPIFVTLEKKESFTEYENLMIEKDNLRNKFYTMFLNSFPSTLFYIGLGITLYQLLPYIYNLGLLIVAPEARVLLEVTNLYKTF